MPNSLTPSGRDRIPHRGQLGVYLGAAPPLGLRPQWIWVEMRIKEIEEAMERYRLKNRPIPEEWDLELHEHRAWCAKHSPLSLHPKPTA